MNSVHPNSASRSLTSALELREAAMLVFCEPLRTEFARLLHRSRKEWQELLRWLDTSGMALYFFDRLKDLNLLDTLPFPVVARLRQNVADNAKRTVAMIVESVAIQQRFQAAGVSYAALKGFSLWPVSVPKMELRSQLDLDFLVADKSANEARRALEEFGYRLVAMSGRSWEFKAREDRPPTLSCLYKAGRSGSAELHLEAPDDSRPSLLSRTQWIPFHGVQMPVLSPIDLFAGQGLHLYKHVCSEFMRAAHVLEFRRHVIARHGDLAFWSELERLFANEPTARMRLGAVILLISHTMDRFAPEALTRWTVDQLPRSARHWVELYGRRAVLASFPGSKLYLLLQKELEAAGIPARRSLRQALLPRALPPAITHPVAGESAISRAMRYGRELQFIFFRLRFHLLEGIRYLRESILWKQYRNGLSQ
jgi:hypothetical protein